MQKLLGKKVVHKSAEATGEMIGNKVADKITNKSRTKKQKEEDNLMEKTQELIFPPEKRKQIIKDLKLFLNVYIKWNATKLIIY